MNPLLLITGAYKFVKTMPVFWKVLRNFGVVKEILIEAKDVVESSLEKGHPSCEDTKKLFGVLRKALDTGLVDLPDYDEHELSSMLYDLESNLVCSVQKVGRGVIRPESVKEEVKSEE